MPRKPHALSPRTMSERAYHAIRKHKTLNPHELLYYWANGIEVAGLKPDPAQQIYCAVASANYYAPKLSNVEIKTDVRVRAVISAAPMTQHQWAQKYLNQESNGVSPQVTYEVAESLDHQNNNTSAELAEAVVAPPGGQHDRGGDVQAGESSESSESLDPPSKS